MFLSYETKCYLQNTSNLLEEIKKYSYFNYKYGEQYLLAQDYCFWLYNEVIEDSKAIFLILINTNNVNIISLRPIYCILRSTLEKYADILNFIQFGRDYEIYLNYLNQESQGILNLENEERKIKDMFKVEICNRKTRYYLLNSINSEFKEEFMQIYNLNKSLSKIDFEYSSILHNNIQKYEKQNSEKIKEILHQLLCILYTTTSLIQNYEQIFQNQLFINAQYLINNFKLYLNSNNIFFM